MKQSKLFNPTTKEVPKDAVEASHILMLRAGMIRQVAGGMYAYLPLADRILNKIQAIIRREMAKIDANEMLMPTMIPAELWQESGRYKTYGPLLYKLTDRKNREFLMAPTHEETFTRIISDDIKSYKKLPIIVYQLQNKYRDELRPRNGLLRGREFIMKDAYSFSADQKGLDLAFDSMDQAYRNIFDAINLNYRVISAHAGAMGGTDSKEFSAIADAGEDIVVYSDASDYSANIEMAKDALEFNSDNSELKDLELVSTPGIKTIEKIADFLQIPITQTVKTLIYKADGALIAILLRGDFDLNEIKLKNHLNVADLESAQESDVLENIGAGFGSLGPVNLPQDIKIYADESVLSMRNFVVGANQNDHHHINVNLNRDFKITEAFDLRNVREGDPAIGGGKLIFTKGIEIGHIFKLGEFYSNSMNAKVQDKNGELVNIIMGSYGIGVSRLLSAIAEQNHDDNGFIWPKSIAPYDIHLIVINYQDEVQKQLTDEIERQLIDAGLEVLVDERNERPGVKFADSDLIGLPYRIVVGKKAGEQIIEFKARKDDDAQEIFVSEILKSIKND